MAHQYEIKGLIATKQGFGEGVLEAARRNRKIIVIGADITGSVGLDLFAREYPDRFISMGIAEQNCVGAAAGLALSGKTPVFATYGVFSAMRTTDFIRISVCYNNLHVLIGGAHAGISVGPDGATHQALEDIAVMRSLPNMTVVSPCDATQTRIATIACLNRFDGPVYLRFGRAPVPDFTSENQHFEIGRAQIMNRGSDATVIATGHMVWEALEAANIMNQEGLKIRVINMHTIKPLDQETVLKAARETGAIVTAEEHQVTGGLGSAVAEFTVKNNPVPIEFVGMNDRFGESGEPKELMDKYGLNAGNIAEKIRMVLKRKQD